jgi:hypothetical protein
MVRVVEQQSMVIGKGGFRLLERNAMLPMVREVLAGIPLEPEGRHNYIVGMS